MFSENYSVCLNDDGSARALERNGPVVTYKAIGYDSGRAVAMQLIPLTSIDEVDRVRFEESARAAQRLDDSNIARCFDGGWPRVKLVNFGLAGLKVRSDSGEMHELVPSMPSQFASPEQLENRRVDFRSDIFSLGAAMWFLLTGAAPSAAAESEPRLSASAVAVPRFVRNLVSQMLRTNSEERPQDLAAFAEKIHACLQKSERRSPFTRRFGPQPG